MTGALQGGADAHQGGADGTDAHQGRAEIPGRDWNLEEMETQEAERAHLVSGTEAGSLSGHGRSSPGSARKEKLGNTLGNVARGKQDFALGECLCAAFM